MYCSIKIYGTHASWSMHHLLEMQLSTASYSPYTEKTCGVRESGFGSKLTLFDVFHGVPSLVTTGNETISCQIRRRWYSMCAGHVTVRRNSQPHGAYHRWAIHVTNKWSIYISLQWKSLKREEMVPFPSALQIVYGDWRGESDASFGPLRHSCSSNQIFLNHQSLTVYTILSVSKLLSV